MKFLFLFFFYVDAFVVVLISGFGGSGSYWLS